jgi:hypothetical protein
LEPIPAFNLIFLGLCVLCSVASFFSANSWQLVTKENPVGFIQRIFMKKKSAKLARYQGFCFHEIYHI